MHGDLDGFVWTAVNLHLQLWVLLTLKLCSTALKEHTKKLMHEGGISKHWQI